MQTYRGSTMYVLRASVAGLHCFRFFFFEFNVKQWVFITHPNEMRIPFIFRCTVIVFGLWETAN